MAASFQTLEHAENDVLIMTSNAIALDELIRLVDILPIEDDELAKSFSSLSFSPTTFNTRKQVSFGGIQSVDCIESVIDMTAEDISDRWFSKEELNGFKQAARDLCKDERSGGIVGAENSTRGMDVYFPNRQRHHAKYVQHVLHAINVHCAGNPVHVALLCKKWSAKVTGRAVEQGQQDFYEAYFPYMAQGGECMPPPCTRPNKRAAPTSEQRVPQRTRSL
jgi:hypothetical protein